MDQEDMPSGWTGQFDLSNDSDLNFFKQFGQKYLASGKADPAVIAKGKALLGQTINPKKVNAQSNEESLIDDAGTKTGKKTSEKTLKTEAIFSSPDQMNQVLGTLRDQPEYAAQQKSTGDLEDALSMVKGLPVKDESWIKPLVALASAESGKNLMAGYENNNFTNRDKYNEILKYSDALSKRRDDIAKNLSEAAGKFKTGSQITGTTYEDMLSNSNDTKHLEKAAEGEKPQKGGAGKSKFYDKYNTDMGADAAKFEGAGGYENVKAQVAKMDKAISIIQKWADADKNSGVIGQIGNQILHGAQSMIGRGSEAAEVSRLINSVSSSGLKDQYGGKITNLEVAQALKNADDATLPNETRLNELRAFRDKVANIGAQTQNAIEFAKQRGGMEGYKGGGLGSANFGPGAPPPANFKPGDTRVKDGVTYQRDSGGQWHPVGGK